MEFLIVTGMSGAGKSTAINVLEDIGYYCIDNIPPQLIPKFADICARSNDMIDKVAIVTDIRGGELFYQLDGSLEALKSESFSVKVLFLDAADEVLLKRYKETRRKHPLDGKSDGNLEKAIAMERGIMLSVRARADYYIDTTALTVQNFRRTMDELFLDNPEDSMVIKVMSFGTKYGASRDADLVFDVRCLPNPYYVPELKEKTGLDKCVRDYVMGFEQSRMLEDKLRDLMDFLIPLYRNEGKTQLIVAFSCTGGKHRSVTFAENMRTYLQGKGLRVGVFHRDIDVH